MEWLDRDKQKKLLSNWLDRGSGPFLLTVMDSQEFEDITKWLALLPGITPSISYLNSDSEVTRFGLLESLVKELGDDKFPKFMALYESLSKTDIKLIVSQAIGADMRTGSYANLQNNTQIINLNYPDPESVKRFFLDSRISEFLTLFLEDFNNTADKKTTLFVCRFRGKGFDGLDEIFKSWFPDYFLRKTGTNEIKTLVLSEQSADTILNTFDYQYRYRLAELGLNDILPVSKQYLNKGDEYCRGFCDVLLDEGGRVTYKYFKGKLQMSTSV